MFSVVCLCEEKVLGTDLNERPTAYYIAFYCLLYCIILSTGFTVRKLYYVSIFFYYASVFDFPKYKKRFIALCYGRKKKSTSFLEVSEFLSQKQSNLVWNWCTHISPCSGIPAGQTVQNQKESKGWKWKCLLDKSKRLAFVLIADCKKFLVSHLLKRGRPNMLEQHQEKKEIKQWKESGDKTLTLPNWK